MKRLNQTEQDEHRRLGLCFNCDEKYSQGHNKDCKRLFLLDSLIEDDDDAPSEEPADAEAPVFSLHAVAGVPSNNTLLLCVALGAASLVALVDTGSSHNFIGEAAASRIGLPIQPRPRLTATVANGERVPCPGFLRQAAISIEGMAFHVDLYVMPLAGYDMVLGTQWMATLGRIAWDFAAGTMAFHQQGRDICWHSVESRSAPAAASITAARPARSGGATPSDATAATSPGDRPLLDDILTSFADVFAEPSGLPPQRGRAHSIHLLPGAAPVAVRPYRYPVAHKDELERQCAAMMEQGLVRRSTSAFSSPVLLVKKADGSWRFCVDYRALNAITVKDAYPIPVVDELLDELHGAKFFTKLDLRSGYHQVRMHPDDIDKTAFRTHDGLYEFLVMPFGLCNAPATFQALMNDILRVFLHRFVLVFFDDILIYSATWADHLRHLRAVLLVLRQHRLFVKRSKCAFGVLSIAYLGHIISAAGVAMDPSKVQAVLDWPQPRSARAVRGFLGLAGYYRKFVHDYGTIAAPLTALTKKDGFSWSEEAAPAFQALKHAVTSAPVLALPDFAQPFVVECDASTYGFGAVLLQGQAPTGLLQPTSGASPPRPRRIRAGADRPRPRHSPLETVPLGAPVRGTH